MTMSYRTQRTVILVSFLTVPLILLGMFSYYPAVHLVYYSFLQWDGLTDKTFVGLRNYKEIVTNAEYFGVLRNNLYYFAGGLLQTGFALYFAVVLNTRLRGRNVFRVILFLPYIMHSVAIVFMFQALYNSQYGTLNGLLDAIGFGNLRHDWLGDKDTVNYALAFVSMWKYMGLSMVIFLGSLQSIPSDLYEAARIDGASAMQQFWRITMPSIRKVLELLLLLTLTGALEAFEIPYIMMLGANGTDTFIMKTVEVAFQFQQVGLGSAMAVIMLIIVLGFVGLQRLLLRGGDDA
ncbi:carbohydrate ABC transporter permease [Paenibacillus whitsoniae]|uniref:Sugar ABC transporter permease n=1 Tax=Paenibacillus whitsoniae TaxID=2496558 RepID=A0A3S0CF06_9BACL|nr:sugar ABC transporter permease [Paenibacillus whitsoniae]RTE11213.1 sugar ABC transporter permease [Paenibacillus whitsoniae]